MYDLFLSAITTISDLMWGPWTVIFIAFVSVYLTVRTRFFQVTSFAYLMRRTFGQIFDRSGDQGKERMTPFQATNGEMRYATSIIDHNRAYVRSADPGPIRTLEKDIE